METSIPAGAFFSSPRRARPAAAPFASISVSRLEEILGDEICLRDARGRSRRPSLVRSRWSGDLAILGEFTVIQRFDISPDEGRDFVDTSRDSNPIHREDSVVPGAMTAARFLIVPETLIPGLAVRRLRVKFRAFSRYDRPTVNVFRVRPDRADSQRTVSVQLSSYQMGVLIAEASIDARVSDPACLPRIEAGPAALASPSADVIRTFLRSLRVDAGRFLEHLGPGYPRAFLASLPSGEMVRKGGEGGLLNVLDLEFLDPAVPAITHEPPPTAEVEPTRPRQNFRRVLARVGSGIKTYCKGYATVLLEAVLGGSRGAGAGELKAPNGSKMLGVQTP